MTIGSRSSACFAFALLLILSLGTTGTSWAKEARVGEVVFVKGEATVTRLPDSKPMPLAFKDPIHQMDILQTVKGELKVRFSDRTIIHLHEKSKVIITEHVFSQQKKQRKSALDIAMGTVRTIVQQFPGMKQNEVRIQTPSAVAGIRGTDVLTALETKKLRRQKPVTTTRFFLNEGKLDVFSLDYTDIVVRVGEDQYIRVDEGFPPHPPLDMLPSVRDRLFTGGASLAEVLKQLTPSEGAAGKPKTQIQGSAPTLGGDEETAPGGQERQKPDEVELPPGKAPVKIPVSAPK